MNQLDDFEKYLRDQLKGHAEPDPLMWKRLTDVIGHMKPWYAKSAVKYIFTAISAMLVGIVSTYLVLNQTAIKPTENKAKMSQKQVESRQPKTAQQSVDKLHSLAENTLQLFSTAASILSPNTASPQEGHTTTTNQVNAKNAAVPAENTLYISTEQLHSAELQTSEISELALLAPLVPLIKCGNKSTLQQLPEIAPGVQRFSMSIAKGELKQELPAFNYQLGPNGQHSAENTLSCSPLLQFQYQVYKNWHLNLGVQMQKQILIENFTQADIYSFDEKEHFLFPYIYGFRSISDEELHEGPWPFGPNPPGGSEVSHVKASFTSTLRTQRIHIPMTLSFHQNFGPFEAQIHTGLTLQFNYNTQNTLSIPGYGTSTLQIQTPPNRFQTLAQSQLRLLYNANRHLGIFIAPQIIAALKQEKYLHTNATRPQTRSFVAGLSWKF